MAFVIAGIVNLKEQESAKYAVNNDKIYLHPDYNNTVMANDLAIVTLTKPLKFSSKMQPICLGTIVEDRLHENESVGIILHICM